MQPGDMVWYESASVVHGRPYPMKGRSYENLFIVFKPRGNWYRYAYLLVRTCLIYFFQVKKISLEILIRIHHHS